MDSAYAVTPDKMFDRLRMRLAGDPVVERSTNPATFGGVGRILRFGRHAHDPRMVFPDLGFDLSASLLVVATKVGLALRLEAGWTSPFGAHTSIAEYVAGKQFTDVTVTAAWQQHLPSPITQTLGVQAHADPAHVHVDDYHRGVLTRLYASSKPLTRILAERFSNIIPAHEFMAVTTVVDGLLV